MHGAFNSTVSELASFKKFSLGDIIAKFSHRYSVLLAFCLLVVVVRFSVPVQVIDWNDLFMC